MKKIISTSLTIVSLGLVSSAKAEVDPVVRGAPTSKSIAVIQAFTKVDMKDAQYALIRVGKQSGTLVTAHVVYQRNANCEILSVGQTEATIEADIVVNCGFGFGRAFSEIEIKKDNDTFKVELGVNSHLYH